MTEEAFKLLQAVFDENEIATEYFDNMVCNANKYRWHDLRKNPEDLPKKIATDYLTISVNGTYIVRTYEGISIKGFLDSYGHDLKTHQREEMQVIAWREIEPFGEEEEE